MSDAQGKDQLLRILVVDDSKLMRKAVSRILKGKNDVVEAEHGEQAWDILQNDDTIKIVCCDLSMPIMDGFGFLELVRKSDDERIRDMPVIIVTGQEDSEENRTRIFEAGATDFVSKPFDSAQLRASIKTHTRLQKTANELKAKASEIEDVAAVDPLTGLGTTAFFRKSAEQAVSYAKRHEQKLIIVRLEIDGFRELFLKIGKEKSSALIKKVGEILSKHTRKEDMLCRMGLDGFAALLMTSDLDGTVMMTERARKMIESIKLKSGDGGGGATVSIGVARVEATGETTVDELLDAAGAYMQKSQQAGGNQVCYDKASVKAAAADKLTVAQALNLLSKGETASVSEQIDGLVQQVLPLLGLYAKTNANGMKQLAQKLLEKIQP